VPWVEVFVVLVVSHLTGDFILQTEFQATNKHGGLRERDPVKRRALFEHTLTYVAAYIPALVWLGTEYSVATLVALVVGIGLPHGLQDDGTAIKWWMRKVKHTEATPGMLAIFVDQSFHMVALLITAALVGT
jgi:hypothetical protein